MSSTTVHSNTAVAGTAIVLNERDKKIEVPQNGKVYEIIENRVDEGSIEIPVGECYLSKDGKLIEPNGTHTMKNPNAYENVQKARKTRSKITNARVNTAEAR